MILIALGRLLFLLSLPAFLLADGLQRLNKRLANVTCGGATCLALGEICEGETGDEPNGQIGGVRSKFKLQGHDPIQAVRLKP